MAVEVPDTLLQLFQLTRQGTLLLVKMVPAEFHSTIVKSPHCEPQFFDDWVETNLNVDAPGATSANLKSLGHTVCARPMYPLSRCRVQPENGTLRKGVIAPLRHASTRPVHPD